MTDDDYADLEAALAREGCLEAVREAAGRLGRDLTEDEAWFFNLGYLHARLEAARISLYETEIEMMANT